MSVQVFEKKSKRRRDTAPTTGTTIYSTPWTVPSIIIGWEVITPKKPEVSEAQKQEQRPSLFKSTEQTDLRVSINEPIKIRFVLKTDRSLEKDEALPITTVKLKIDETEKDITWNVNWVKQDPSTGEFVGEYKITFDKPGKHTIQLGIQYNLLKGTPLNPEKPAYRSPLIWSDPVVIDVSESKEGEKVVELTIKGELPRITTMSTKTESVTKQEITKVAEGVSFSGFRSVYTPEERKQIESSPPSETPLPALTLQYAWKEIAPGVREGEVIFPIEVEVWIPNISIDRLKQIHRELINLYDAAKKTDIKHWIGQASSTLGYLLTFWRDDFNGFVYPDFPDWRRSTMLDSLSSAISLAKIDQPEIVDRLQQIYNELSTLTFTKKKMWTYKL